MSERLQQLQRQQALMREHLAWLDAEIARERGPESSSAAAPNSDPGEGSGPAVSQALAATRAPRLSPPALPVWKSSEIGPTPEPSPASSLSREAQALIDQYAVDENAQREDMRRGCFIVFAVALAVLILSVTAVWWFGYRKPV